MLIFKAAPSVAQPSRDLFVETMTLTHRQSGKEVKVINRVIAANLRFS